MPTKEEEERIRADERNKEGNSAGHMVVQGIMTPLVAVPVVGWAAYCVGSVVNLSIWGIRKLAN